MSSLTLQKKIFPGLDSMCVKLRISKQSQSLLHQNTKLLIPSCFLCFGPTGNRFRWQESQQVYIFGNWLFYKLAKSEHWANAGRNLQLIYFNIICNIDYNNCNIRCLYWFVPKCLSRKVKVMLFQYFFELLLISTP